MSIKKEQIKIDTVLLAVKKYRPDFGNHFIPHGFTVKVIGFEEHDLYGSLVKVMFARPYQGEQPVVYVGLTHITDGRYFQIEN